MSVRGFARTVLGLAGGAAAVAQGIGLVWVAFAAFLRIYSFLPWVDIAILVGFAVGFSAFLILAGWKYPEFPEEKFAVSLAIGLGLGLFAMGGWELGIVSLAGFPIACFLAYLGVAATFRAKPRLRAWTAAFVATLAFLGGVLPAVLLDLRLSMTTIYEPELMREVALASFLALMAFAVFIGLIVALWRGQAPARSPRPPRAEMTA